MAEQAIDLRSTLPVLRRHRRTLAAAATVGAAAGVCCLLLWPPMYSSASQVLLPPLQSAPDSSGQTTRDVETTVRVATSEVVVGPAAKALKPPMSPSALARQVKASAPSNEILEIEAKAETPGRAREIADAVAKAEVTYVTEASSSLTAAQQAELATRRKNLQASLDKVNVQIDKTTARKRTQDPASSQAKADASALARLTSEQANLVLQLDEVKSRAAGVQPTAGASIIQAASPAKRPGLVQRFVLYAMLGVLLALTAASALLLAVARRDRRVRYRDQIADAVGSPVMVSVRSRVPRTAAGWKSLLEDYDPGVVDGWAFRQALRQLESEESGAKRRRPGQRDGTIHHPLSITVVTFSDDLRALAVGPQLAAYAASTGIRTRLVAARGQDSAAPLWAACSGGKDEELRPGLLVSTRYREQDDVELTVVLAVVDRRDPELADLPVTAVSIMALSPGVATVEDLARTAVTADDAAMRIAGVIVADPDALDKTTGRLLQHERAQQVPLPTRLTGMGAPAAAVSKPARGNAGPTSTRSSPGRGSTGRPGGSNSRRRQG